MTANRARTHQTQQRTTTPQQPAPVTLQATPGLVQPRLTIGPVDDPYEREAERVAEQVMRMPAPSVQPAPALIQRAADGATPEITPAIEGQIQALRGGGQPLDADVRSFMEPRFGYDFATVRVHTGPQAARAASSVNALAFTLGRDVVFGAGQYQPGSTAGQRLIAHELTHVVQQRWPLQRQPIENAPETNTLTISSTKKAPNFDLPELKLELKSALQSTGASSLWSLLDKQPLSLEPHLPLLPLKPQLSTSNTYGAQPFRIAFGPMSRADTLAALEHVSNKPDWFSEMLRPRGTHESDLSVWLIYENDGRGPFTNQGSGSDQGRTAALYLYATFNKQGTGLSRIGLTGIEMVTPKGTLPEGMPKNSSSTYQTPSGPYSGVAAIDIGVTVSRTGHSHTDFILVGGVDSREWGELVQGIIHKKISDSPIFPWPSGTKPLLEGGINWGLTIDDLTRNEFAGLKYTGRLEIDLRAITGTRRTEGTVGARFVVRTAHVYTPVGAISAEFSPIGAFARGFARYNDGRSAPIVGAEGGVNAGLMLNIGPVGVGMIGEMLVSSDPAFQTDNAAGTSPTAIGAFGTVSSGPAGHHGVGKLVLRVDF